VELALASGLVLLPADQLQPLAANSFGTGELVRAALDQGCTTVARSRGSACTDGGAGLLQALARGSWTRPAPSCRSVVVHWGIWPRWT